MLMNALSCDLFSSIVSANFGNNLKVQHVLRHKQRRRPLMLLISPSPERSSWYGSVHWWCISHNLNNLCDDRRDNMCMWERFASLLNWQNQCNRFEFDDDVEPSGRDSRQYESTWWKITRQTKTRDSLQIQIETHQCSSFAFLCPVRQCDASREAPPESLRIIFKITVKAYQHRLHTNIVNICSIIDKTWPLADTWIDCKNTEGPACLHKCVTTCEFCKKNLQFAKTIDSHQMTWHIYLISLILYT